VRDPSRAVEGSVPVGQLSHGEGRGSGGPACIEWPAGQPSHVRHGLHGGHAEVGDTAVVEGPVGQPSHVGYGGRAVDWQQVDGRRGADERDLPPSVEIQGVALGSPREGRELRPPLRGSAAARSIPDACSCSNLHKLCVAAPERLHQREPRRNPEREGSGGKVARQL
jgi:hypothetical protein